MNDLLDFSSPSSRSCPGNMSSMFDDQLIRDALKHRACKRKPSIKFPATFECEVLDWTQEQKGGTSKLIPRKVSVPELVALPIPPVRIIFSPLDLPTNDTIDELLRLFDHFAVPSAFIAGRIRSVTHSFGALDDMSGYNCSWFHYLCKNITLKKDSQNPEKRRIYDPRAGVKQLEHSDSTWIRSGYFLRWRSGSFSNREVTLICFEASAFLKERFRMISPSSILTDAVSDPYSLLVIILEELSLQMNNTFINVGDVFRQIEENTLREPRDMESFTGLHNVSKHITFLQESVDAISLTMKNLLSHHQKVLDSVSLSDRQSTEMAQRMLVHTETQFQSTGLGLKSLSKRMENIIALSFHLVTQEGNRIMQSENTSMATIALVTLIFLPLSVVSTIFGSQFFDFDRGLIKVSHSFWVFWLVSIPLTFLVLLFWYLAIRRPPPLKV